MLQKFLNTIKEALANNTFISLTLSGYSGNDDLKNVYLKKILIKAEEKLSFTYRHKTKDIVKNYSFIDAILLLQNLLDSTFTIANLFTTENDWVLERSNVNFGIKQKKASKKEAPSLLHNEEKKHLISTKKSTYLHLLNITDERGNVFKTTQDKFRQINHYIEILSSLLKELPKNKMLHIADMGSGKGYLTFALYDYLANNLNIQTTITGVEFRKDLVKLCNDIAKKIGFVNLNFEEGSIDSYLKKEIDVLIALHACDTATDDAIAKGIKANAQLIVVAPCCHKQIRKQIEKTKHLNDISFITKHGIFLERQAEMFTDAIRAMILEYFGYKTKVFEFITDAHTPKNIMITAEKKFAQKNETVLQKIKNAKAFFGIEEHYLERLMTI